MPVTHSIRDCAMTSFLYSREDTNTENNLGFQEAPKIFNDACVKNVSVKDMTFVECNI